jgi:6-phosphogluconolactonase
MANRAIGIAVLLVLITGLVSAQTKTAHKYVLYVGTYTERGSKGIYAFNFDSANGRMTPLGLKAELANPSFVTLSPDGQFLYAVSEVDNFQGRHSGGVAGYRTDAASGGITLLNQTPSIGEGPCHLSIDKTGKFLLVANYDSGSVSSFALEPDGKVGKVASFVQHLGASVDPERQKGPHAHFIETTADNKLVIAADLGLDQLLLYKFNAADGSLGASSPPHANVRAGEGPRHFVFSPNQKYVYVVTELDSSVSTLTFDAQQGKLEQKQTLSAIPKDFKGKSDAAEIQIDAKGKFLYVSTRGPDSIAVFKISPTDGTLTMVQTVPSGGKTPRYFAIDPSGKFLLAGNQDSDSIVTFRISQKTGKLLKVGEAVSVISPVSFAFLKMK